jgi:hypothetical protein
MILSTGKFEKKYQINYKSVDNVDKPVDSF